MKLLQAVIILAVVGSNIQWQWTPNSYVAGFLAIAAAFFITALMLTIADLYRKLAGFCRRVFLPGGIASEHRGHERLPTRAGLPRIGEPPEFIRRALIEKQPR